MSRINLSALIALGLALVALDALVTVASATDVKITCTAPTKNTDGTDITAAQGALTFNLYGGLQGQTKQKLVTGATSCSFTRTAVAFGTQEYQATAVALGVESPASNTASTVVPPPTPGPPTNTVVVTLVAYEMRGSTATNDLRMVRVGRVYEGTSCLQTTVAVGGKKYQQLPDRAVVNDMALEQLSKAPKASPVLWGFCG